MTITIPITAEVETKLRERAAAIGTDIVQYAAEVLERGVGVPTVEEILAETRHDVARSGMSDDEFMESGRSELAAFRADKKQVRS